VAGRSSGPIVTVRAWNRAPIEDLRLSPYAVSSLRCMSVPSVEPVGVGAVPMATEKNEVGPVRHFLIGKGIPAQFDLRDYSVCAATKPLHSARRAEQFAPKLRVPRASVSTSVRWSGRLERRAPSSPHPGLE
jgi:hypothetical protein